MMLTYVSHHSDQPLIHVTPGASPLFSGPATLPDISTILTKPEPAKSYKAGGVDISPALKLDTSSKSSSVKTRSSSVGHRAPEKRLSTIPNAAKYPFPSYLSLAKNQTATGCVRSSSTSSIPTLAAQNFNLRPGSPPQVIQTSHDQQNGVMENGGSESTTNQSESPVQNNIYKTVKLRKVQTKNRSESSSAVTSNAANLQNGTNYLGYDSKASALSVGFGSHSALSFGSSSNASAENEIMQLIAANNDKSHNAEGSALFSSQNLQTHNSFSSNSFTGLAKPGNFKPLTFNDNPYSVFQTSENSNFNSDPKRLEPTRLGKRSNSFSGYDKTRTIGSNSSIRYAKVNNIASHPPAPNFASTFIVSPKIDKKVHAFEFDPDSEIRITLENEEGITNDDDLDAYVSEIQRSFTATPVAFEAADVNDLQPEEFYRSVSRNDEESPQDEEMELFDFGDGPFEEHGVVVASVMENKAQAQQCTLSNKRLLNRDSACPLSMKQKAVSNLESTLSVHSKAMVAEPPLIRDTYPIYEQRRDPIVASSISSPVQSARNIFNASSNTKKFSPVSTTFKSKTVTSSFLNEKKEVCNDSTFLVEPVKSPVTESSVKDILLSADRETKFPHSKLEEKLSPVECNEFAQPVAICKSEFKKEENKNETAQNEDLHANIGLESSLSSSPVETPNEINCEETNLSVEDTVNDTVDLDDIPKYASCTLPSTDIEEHVREVIENEKDLQKTDETVPEPEDEKNSNSEKSPIPEILTNPESSLVIHGTCESTTAFEQVADETKNSNASVEPEIPSLDSVSINSSEVICNSSSQVVHSESQSHPPSQSSPSFKDLSPFVSSSKSPVSESVETKETSPIAPISKSPASESVESNATLPITPISEFVDYKATSSIASVLESSVSESVEYKATSPIVPIYKSPFSVESASSITSSSSVCAFAVDAQSAILPAVCTDNLASRDTNSATLDNITEPAAETLIPCNLPSPTEFSAPASGLVYSAEVKLEQPTKPSGLLQSG